MENLTVISGSGERFDLRLPEPESIRKTAEALRRSLLHGPGSGRSAVLQSLAPFFPPRFREQLADISESDVCKLISAFNILAGEESPAVSGAPPEAGKKTPLLQEGSVKSQEADLPVISISDHLLPSKQEVSVHAFPEQEKGTFSLCADPGADIFAGAPDGDGSLPEESPPADTPGSSERKPGILKKYLFPFLKTLAKGTLFALGRKYLPRPVAAAGSKVITELLFPGGGSLLAPERKEEEESAFLSESESSSLPVIQEREKVPGAVKSLSAEKKSAEKKSPEKKSAEKKSPEVSVETEREQERSFSDEVIAAAYCYKWHLEYAASLPAELLERCLATAGVRLHSPPPPPVSFSAQEISDALRRNKELRERLKNR